MERIVKQNKSGVYKASNVTFNPNTKVAVSYDWWTFVSVINGKLVFNNHRYSITTARHQYKVMDLLLKLGMKPDLIINTAYSLTNNEALNNARSVLLQKIKYYNDEIDAKGSQHGTNVIRQLAIDNAMNDLACLESLISA